MEPRPLGNPGELIACATALKSLSAQASGLAGQTGAAIKNPGFSGLGAAALSIGGVNGMVLQPATPSGIWLALCDALEVVVLEPATADA